MGCRRGSDPSLLWLWHRLEAMALIRSLAWKPTYAVGAALGKAKRQKKKRFCAVIYIVVQYLDINICSYSKAKVLLKCE